MTHSPQHYSAPPSSFLHSSFQFAVLFIFSISVIVGFGVVAGRVVGNRIPTKQIEQNTKQIAGMIRRLNSLAEEVGEIHSHLDERQKQVLDAVEKLSEEVAPEKEKTAIE